MRIGHAEYIDYDHQFISTSSRSSISIDYPNGVHYPSWFIPLKLKLIVSSSLSSSFIIRCRFKSVLSVSSIQTNVIELLNHYIQIEDRQNGSQIDFHLIINQANLHDVFEVDLATIIFTINGTELNSSSTKDFNHIYSVDWFLISNNSLIDPNEPLLRTPIHIEFDDIQTIVALTDFTRLINTAMLSMQAERYPLRILSVNFSG